MNDLPNQLSKLIKTFNDKRVISQEELAAFSKAIVEILKANKKAVETLNAETKQVIIQAFADLEARRSDLLNATKRDLQASKDQIEKDAKAQSDRVFKRFQALVDEVQLRTPADGRDGEPGKDGDPGPAGAPGIPGRDGSPDNPEEVRDKLETLQGDERLDVSAIKGLEKYFGKVYKKGKDMLVGGIRFLSQLVDVRITNIQDGEVLEWDATNQYWKNGTASGSGTPGGSDTQVQFNDSNTFGGDAGFTYNKTTDIATLGGLVTGDIHTVDSNTPTDINVVAGSAVSGDNNGANLYFQAGYGQGTGTGGYIEFQGPAWDVFADDNEFTLQHNSSIYNLAGAGNNAKFDVSNVTTSDKTFTLPNRSGQVGLFDSFSLITVSAVAPSSPQVGDLWVDIS